MTRLAIYPHELVARPGARQRIRWAERRRQRELAAKAAEKPAPIIVHIPIAVERDLVQALDHASTVLSLAMFCMMNNLRVPGDVSQEIIRETAIKHGLEVEDITGPRRRQALVIARHEAMYRIHQERKNMSLPMIGRLFHRDHTTVLSGIRAHARRAAMIEAERAENIPTNQCGQLTPAGKGSVPSVYTE